MKLFLICILILCSFNVFSQKKPIHLEGCVVDEKSKPVSDVYIINQRNLEKAVSNGNGIFDLWILPEDTVVFSHISYFRKIIPVYQLMINPVIQLDIFKNDLPEVSVSPNQKNEYEQARKNTEFLKEMDIREFVKIKTETNPVSESIKENNRIFRTEASSVSIIRFSPSEQIGNLVNKIKRRKTNNSNAPKKKK